MAKKKSTTSKKTDIEEKGFITFDLLSDETFNPVIKEKEEIERDKAELAQTREYMREASWVDVVQGVLDVYPQQQTESELAFKKKQIPYNQLSKFIIKNSYFMVLQGYSHLFPIEAQALNNKYINEVDATNYIKLYMRSQKKINKFKAYKRFWPISLKEKKKVYYTKENGVETNREIELDNIKDFCKAVNWSLTDYNTYCELYSKDEAEELVCQFMDKSSEKPKAFIKLKKSEMNAYDDDVDHTIIPRNEDDEEPETVPVDKPKSKKKDKSVTQKAVEEPPVNSLFFDDEPPKPAPQPIPIEPVIQKPISTEIPAMKKTPEKKEPKITMPPIIQGTVPNPVQKTEEHKKKHKVEIDPNAPVFWRPIDLHIVDNIC